VSKTLNILTPRVIAYLCLGFLVGMLPTSPLANADSAITKTVTVKDSAGHLYAGAQVVVVYYQDGQGDETFSNPVTTNSQGQATISYPSFAAYESVLIEPPATDQTNAIAFIDLNTTDASALSNVTLKSANLHLQIKTPVNTDAGAGTCITTPKSPSDKYNQYSFRLTRTGPFGVNIPNGLVAGRDYFISPQPCAPADRSYLAENYGFRVNQNGTYSLYTNTKYSTPLTPTGNVYTLAFANSTLRGQVKNPDGTNFQLPQNSYAYARATPITSNGDIETNRRVQFSNSMSSNGQYGFWTYPVNDPLAYGQSPMLPGKYQMEFEPSITSAVSMPWFVGQSFWVDSNGYFSTSQNGTYSNQLTIDATIPSTGVSVFRAVDGSGATLKGGYVSILKQQSNATFHNLGAMSMGSDGLARAIFPDGTYHLIYSLQNSANATRTYTLTVSGSALTLKDENNQTINLTSGAYNLSLAALPNIQFQVVSPVDNTTPISSVTYELDKGLDGSGGYYTDGFVDSGTVISSLNAENGNYKLTLSPNGRTDGKFVGTFYTVTVTNNVAVIKNSAGTVINATNSIYKLALSAPGVSGVVTTSDGTTRVRFANVSISAPNNNAKVLANAGTDSGGNFAFQLDPTVFSNGTYWIQAFPDPANDNGQGISETSTITLTNGSGPTNLTLKLRTSNVSGLVSGLNSPSPNNWLSFSKNTGGNNFTPVNNQALTDESGNYTTFLEPGTYKIQANSDYVNSGGVQNDGTTCVVGSNLSTVNTCNISLKVPNVTGSVTVGGVAPANIQVGFISSTNAGKGNGVSLWAGYVPGNKFGAFVDPGTYRLWVYYETYSGDHVAVPGPACVVPSTGAVVCDASMPANNLSVSISNSSGTLLKNGVSISLSVKQNGSYTYTCCADLNTTNETSVISASLLDGSYQIGTINNTNDNFNGLSQTYDFDVVNGIVTNFKIDGSNIPISPSGGVYALSLKPAAISGTLFRPDGVTPVGNTAIFVSRGPINLSQWSTWVYTDYLGHFAVDMGNTVVDGAYQLLAQPNNYPNSLYINSDVVIDTVTSGVGLSNFTMHLNNADIQGTVSGPSGPAKNDSVQILKNVGGSYVSTGITAQVDSSGHFSAFVPLGNYEISAGGDFANAGGIDTIGPVCSIASVDTLTTCNVVLGTPNVSGHIKVNGATPQWSFITFMPAPGIANNTAKQTYWWNYASQGSFGMNVLPGTYQMFLNGGVNNEWTLEPMGLCVVPASGNATCDSNLPAINFTAKILNSSGASISGNTFTQMQILSGNQYLAVGGGFSSASQYDYELLDGDYKLVVGSDNTLANGMQQEYIFTVSNHVVSGLRSVDSATVSVLSNGVYTLFLKKPNVIGTLTGPNGVAGNDWIQTQQLNSSNRWTWMGNAESTDSNGKYAFSLAPGIYRFYAGGNFETTGGADTYSDSFTVGADTSTTLTVDMLLKAPNVTGSLTTGASANSGQVLFIPASGLAGNTANQSYGWIWTSTGAYGANMAPGTYRSLVWTYPNNIQTIDVGPLCVVPSSGNTTCNIALPAANVKLQLLNSQGSAPTGSMHTNLVVTDGTGSVGACCNSTSTWNGGPISLHVLDGSYTLYVGGDNPSTDGIEQAYSLTVLNGAVTSFINLRTSQAVGAVNGTYQVTSAPAQFAGTVYRPDGVTPAVNVLVFAQGIKYGSSAWTDASGRFAINLGANALDGQYQLTTTVNYIRSSNGDVDTMVASSSAVSETLTSGVGPQNISIVLHKSNVVGVVTAPKGLAANTYLNIQSLDGLGNWNYLSSSAQTNSLGQFGAYLTTGSYRFTAYPDYQSTGGSQTTSPTCVVNSDSSTLTICNFAVNPPNLTGLVTIDSNVVTNGQVNVVGDQGTPGSGWSIPQYWTRVASDGTYGQSVVPGTYQLNLQTWGNTGQTSMYPTGLCTVPSSGNKVCNIALPATNFTYTVNDSAGTLNTSGVYSSLEIKSGNSWNWSCCSYPDPTSAGRFTASLLDGSYRLTVRPNNGSVLGISQTYLFDVDSGVVTNLHLNSGGSNISPVNGVYPLQLQASAISGIVYGTDGQTPVSNVQVISTLNGSSYCCAWTGSDGRFQDDYGMTLADGIWQVQALGIQNSLTVGASTVETITVSNGHSSGPLSFTLRAPNLTGVVSGPNGISQQNWVQVRQILDNGNSVYLQNVNFSTDSQGRFAFALDPGRYQITAQDDLAGAGGTSNTSEICTVAGNQSTPCNIALKVPNVSGTITVNGVAAPGSINFLSFSNQGGQNNFGAGSQQNGTYAANLAPGTYQTMIFLWSGTQLFGPSCVVPVSGSVTCNMTFGAPNFNFNIVNTSNVVMTSNAYSALTRNYGFTSWGTCCNQLNVNGASGSSGVSHLSLLDGNYTIHVISNDPSVGTDQSYLVVVDSGVVTSVRNATTQILVTATNGIFALRLATPSISGTVTDQSGITTVPNAYVQAYQNPYSWNSSWTNANGHFAFSQMADGTYQVVASPAWGDSTHGSSLPTSVQVSGGSSTNQVTLQLRTPNVTGIVSGVKGPARRDWVSVQRQLNGGGWENPQYINSILTSQDGSFAFTLPAGTYRFLANGDLQNAGGTSGYSSNCLIPDTGTVTCNIALPVPNFAFKIVQPDGITNNPGSWASIYFAGDGSVVNYNPSLTWNPDGSSKTALENGTWNLYENAGSSSLYSDNNFTITVVNGVVTSVKSTHGDTYTADVSGTYKLPLQGSNLTGAITFNGSVYEGTTLIYLQTQSGNSYYTQYGKWANGNSFGFKVPSGTYRALAIPYYVDPTQVAGNFSTPCTVVDNGAADCSIALQVPNLIGNLVTQDSDAYRNTSANLYVSTDNGLNWLQNVQIVDGKVGLYLPTGTYQIEFDPYWNYSSTFTSKTYIITVVNNVVTSVVDKLSNQANSPTNGVYTFTLGTPSVQGYVYGPGNSTTGIANVVVGVSMPGGLGNWRYSTSSDQNGHFGLLVPDGTYEVQALPSGGGMVYGKSDSQTVVVANGAIQSPIILHLHSPNLTGTIIDPNTSAPIPNVNVNIWVDGESFYAWTGSDGKFAVYVNNQHPNCPSRCSINLNYYNGSDYTSKSYQISSISDQGNLAMGGVNLHVTGQSPVVNGKSTPNSYGYVSVLQLTDTSTGAGYWVTGSSEDKNGLAGLNLTAGNNYKIWLYPNKDLQSSYAAKSVELDHFDPTATPTLTISFDAPNFTFTVKGSDGATSDSYAWFSVNQVDPNNPSQILSSLSNHLDVNGAGGMHLASGTYKIQIAASGIPGVSKTFTVLSTGDTATVTSGTGANDYKQVGLARIQLDAGNVSGVITDASGNNVTGAIVSATAAGVANPIVATTNAKGYYTLNLDMTKTWTIQVIDPQTAQKGTLNPAVQPSPATVLANQNLQLASS